MLLIAYLYLKAHIEAGVLDVGNENASGVKTIRIYHECEGRIEQYVPNIDVWHHEACRVMTNDDPEGRIFLSYPHTNNGYFLAHHCFYLFIYFKLSFKLQAFPEYAKIQFHMMTLDDVLGKIFYPRVLDILIRNARNKRSSNCWYNITHNIQCI